MPLKWIHFYGKWYRLCVLNVKGSSIGKEKVRVPRENNIWGISKNWTWKQTSLMKWDGGWLWMESMPMKFVVVIFGWPQWQCRDSWYLYDFTLQQINHAESHEESWSSLLESAAKQSQIHLNFQSIAHQQHFSTGHRFGPSLKYEVNYAWFNDYNHYILLFATCALSPSIIVLHWTLASH